MTKGYVKNAGLKYQLKQHLKSLDKRGTSKHQAKQEYKEYCKANNIKWNPAKADGIFSDKSMEITKVNCTRFINWVQANYSPDERRLLEDTRPMATQYLQDCINRGLAPSTIHTYANSLSKIYNCSANDLIKTPQRITDEFTKHKPISHYEDKKGDFNITKHSDLVTFNRATGCRREEITGDGKAQVGVSSKDIYEKDGKVYVNVIGKGGKARTIEVRQEYKREVLRIKEERKDQKKLFEGRQYPARTPSHSFRREYAKEKYKEIENRERQLRPIENNYKTKDGRMFNREILKELSKQLGHNRIDVVANNYLR